MKTRMIFLITLLATLGACAKSSSGNSNDTNDIQSVGKQLVIGNWKDTCKTWGSGDQLSSGYTTASFAESTVVFVGENYKSTDCTGEKTSSMKMTFSFEIPSRSSLGANVFDFNTTPRNVVYIISDQDTVNVMNTLAYCGFTDWVVGVEKDITGKSCFIGPKSGEVIYSVMKITETQLQLGEPDDSHIGKTPEQRHVQFASQSFIKIQ